MNIVQLYNSFGQIKENTWLDGRSYSDAFVLAISSGPWRAERRFKIQQDAISFVAGRDLSEINSEVDFYPLSWQNKYLNSIIHSLQLMNKTMDKFCKLVEKEIVISNSRQLIYSKSGSPKGAKVLSLFCRDRLKIPTFTIDRHVKKYLIDHNLPTKEDEMIKLCKENNIDPRLFSLAIAQSSGIKNPDWSC